MDKSFARGVIAKCRVLQFQNFAEMNSRLLFISNDSMEQELFNLIINIYDVI